MQPRHQRIESIDFLRGIASLMVCWYHFTNSDPTFLPSGILKASGAYGWLGVEVFFVISGFIIPYSLEVSGYNLSRYPTFLLKRITRLDPPYLVSVVLAIIIISGSVFLGLRDHDDRLNWIGILLHLGYLNVIFNYPWLNAVYWTLAIEFQYYLMIGLLFPLLNSSRRVVRILCLAGLVALSFVIRPGSFIFHWITLFCLGISAFQFKRGKIGKLEFALLVIGFAVAGFFKIGFVQLLAGLIALCVIMADARIKHSVFNFLGTISYSLYLLHALTGAAAVAVGEKLGLGVSYAGKFGLILIAVAVSIVTAYLLYLFVERPAQAWSSSFKYKKPVDTCRPRLEIPAIY